MLAEAHNSALVIIDFQPKLATAISDSDFALENCVKLVKAANILALPYIVSEQYPQGLGHTDSRITAHVSPGTPCLEKTCFSCVDAPPFVEHLNKINKHQVVLCGMEAHVCVLQTALQLQQQNHTVFAVEDAICSRSIANKANAIARMRHAGIIISNTESILFEWMRDAKHPQFKAISALIK